MDVKQSASQQPNQYKPLNFRDSNSNLKQPKRGIPWWIWLFLAGALIVYRWVPLLFEPDYDSELGWQNQQVSTWDLWTVDRRGTLYILNAGGDNTISLYKKPGLAEVVAQLPPELADLKSDIHRFAKSSLRVDDDEHVWIFLANNQDLHDTPNFALLALFAGGEWKIFTEETPVDGTLYFDLFVDESNRAWLASEHGLAMVDSAQSSTTFKFDDYGLDEPDIQGFAINNSNQVWVVNGGELMSRDPDEKWTSYGKLDRNSSKDGTALCWMKDDFSGFVAARMQFDAKGQLWVQMLNESVDKSVWFIFHPNGSSAGCYSDFRYSVLDRQGRFWGISGSGISLGNASTGVIRYPAAKELRNFNGDIELVVDARGRAWVGAGHRVMYIFEPPSALQTLLVWPYNLIFWSLVGMAGLSLYMGRRKL